jgi:SAM-dependent methyltransferase
MSLAERVGGPVLELACGGGRALLPFARAGYECVGLELSPHMLSFFERKLAEEPEKVRRRIRVVKGDMTAPSLDREFGTVFIAARSFQALLTRGEQRSCLEACARHLKPGGLLGIDVFNPRLGYVIAPAGVDNERDELTGPDGVRITVSYHTDYNPREQSLRSVWRHEFVDADGRPQCRDYAVDLHYFFRFEMEWMLEACGFEVEALYGNFDRSPFTADSPEMIFVARRAE